MEKSDFLCYHRIMKNENICKFITRAENHDLTVHHFIYESVVADSGKTFNYPEHSLFIITEGRGLFRVGDGVYRLGVGDIAFSFKNVPYSVQNDGDLKFYNIRFCGERADRLLSRFGITPKSAVFSGMESVLPLIQNSLIRADGENIDLVSESMLLYVLSRLDESVSAVNDVALQTLKYLEQNFTDPALTLKTLSQTLGYNDKYISRVFKTQYKVGVCEYLKQLRIKNAMMLIEGGVTSVKNIAALSGFADPLYFSKVFTKTVGVSPKNYKK